MNTTSCIALLMLSGAGALAAPPDHARHVAGQPARDSVDLGRSRLSLILVPPGVFQMGSPQVLATPDGWDNEVERPVHQVTITKGFWIGEFSITQRQWEEVMGNNPSYFAGAGPDLPVEQVSWTDAQAFIAKVNGKQTRWTVRLPTEAEWEYAARAGTTGETYGPVDSIAWYAGNNSRTTHPVGQKRPNGFGLYDMLGNVWQWCEDWFAPYASAPAIDPQGPPDGEKRVMRGGCWYCDAIHARAARRNRDPQEHLSRSIGFRIVAVPRAGSAGG
jgi:formylglycine-generating enzyme required for sulfatase activity